MNIFLRLNQNNDVVPTLYFSKHIRGVFLRDVFRKTFAAKSVLVMLLKERFATAAAVKKKSLIFQFVIRALRFRCNALSTEKCHFVLISLSRHVL